MTEAANSLLQSALSVVFWIMSAVFVCGLLLLALAPLWVKK